MFLCRNEIAKFAYSYLASQYVKISGMLQKGTSTFEDLVLRMVWGKFLKRVLHTSEHVPPQHSEADWPTRAIVSFEVLLTVEAISNFG